MPGISGQACQVHFEPFENQEQVDRPRFGPVKIVDSVRSNVISLVECLIVLVESIYRK